MDNVRDYFNVVDCRWSENLFEERKNYKIIDNFYYCYSKVRNNKPKILDVGCGVGYDSKHLSELGARVTGIDFAENRLDVALNNAHSCEFRVCDISAKSSIVEKYDGIVCLDTLNYIGIEKMKQVFENFSNMTRSGALLLISVLDGSSKDLERSRRFFNGKEFDLNFSRYNVEQLCTFAHPYFKLVDTWQYNDFNDGWRYYIFMRQPIK